MRKAKSDYYRQTIDAYKATAPKTVWNIINSLLSKGNKTTLVNDILINDNISDDNDIAESFSNIGPN